MPGSSAFDRRLGDGGTTQPRPPRRPRRTTALALVAACGLAAVVTAGWLQIAGDGDALAGLGSLDGATVTTSGAPPALRAACLGAPDADERPDCTVVSHLDGVQSYWGSSLPGYRPTRVRFFRGATATGCGPVSSEDGSLYCPRDRVVYVDLDFLAALRHRLDEADARLAQAYVLAHEVGHHVQLLQGALPDDGAPSPARRIALELGADCLAGVWLATAIRSGWFPGSSPARVTGAFRAAAAIASARARRGAPDAATHGRIPERARWLHRGLASITPERCSAP